MGLQGMASNPDFTVKPLSAAMGAEVVGLDLSSRISQPTFQALRDLFLEHKVLCFRDQKLTQQRLHEFSGLWGPVGEHIRKNASGTGYDVVLVMSNADANGNPNGKHTDASAMRWHTDRSFMQKPALATLLYGVTVPPEGGDTLFANMADAYDALSGEEQARIEPLRAIHSIEESRKKGGTSAATEDEIRRAPLVLHGLVKVHPATGRKNLYIGAHAWKVGGLDETEGKELLENLVQHATQDRFVYAHKWREGDLVMWDNRSVLHAASEFDGAKHLRVMWRTIVDGVATDFA